ncbi:MAG TPA: CoA transferase [Dehalococcoidia bacterium]|nr:CoA transferase [Dehalococcoidia bacterium]
MAKKPLQGIRVIEFGLYIALPLATRLLASMGAEVIKVETLTSLDMSWFGPIYAPGALQLEYRPLKRNVTLDVRQPRGKEIMEELLKKSDVYITNLGEGALTKYGLTFDHVRSLKKDLIVLWQTGLGSTGPYGGYKAYGRLMQHACAVSTISGTPDSLGVANVSYSDYHTSVFNAMAIIGALERRRRTGEGCFIECPIYESGVVTVGPAFLDYQVNKVIPERRENRHRFFAPHGAYPCKGTDRWCTIAVTNEEEWKAFCGVIGNPAWTKSPQFATAADRVKNAKELDRLVGEWTSKRNAHQVMERMQKAGVPAGIVSKGEDLANSEHLKSHEFYKHTEYYAADFNAPGVKWPVAGTSPVFSEPIYFSETPVMFGPMHKVGQDNNYVYGKLLGMSKEEIKKLTKEGVFA